MSEDPIPYGGPAPELSTEQRILDAARRVFMTKGFDGARMQEIADAAEINKALLHYYFRSKEQLFERIFQDLTNTINTSFVTTLQLDCPFPEKLCRIVYEEMRHLVSHPELPMFIIREISRDAERLGAIMQRSPMRQAFGLFAQQTQEAIARGEIRAIEPVQLILHVLSLTRFPVVAMPMICAVTSISKPDYQQILERRADEVCQLLLLSLQP